MTLCVKSPATRLLFNNLFSLTAKNHQMSALLIKSALLLSSIVPSSMATPTEKISKWWRHDVMVSVDIGTNLKTVRKIYLAGGYENDKIVYVHNQAVNMWIHQININLSACGARWQCDVKLSITFQSPLQYFYQSCQSVVTFGVISWRRLAIIKHFYKTYCGLQFGDAIGLVDQPTSGIWQINWCITGITKQYLT